MTENDHLSTRGERRQERRRRRRQMGVSGKGFVNAIRNAILKRKLGGGNKNTA